MAKKQNYFVVLLMSLFLFSGCQTLPDILDNPMYVEIGARQAVARYIDAGNTEEEKNKRAANVVDTVSKALEYLDGYPRATASDLVTAVESNISWEKLSYSDRFLVKDIMTYLRMNLEEKQHEGLIESNVIIRVRALLNTIIVSAGYI